MRRKQRRGKGGGNREGVREGEQLERGKGGGGSVRAIGVSDQQTRYVVGEGHIKGAMP